MTRTVTALHPDDPRHGTLNGYNNCACRCKPCGDAIKAYKRWQRTRKASRLPQYVHGGEAGMLRYLVGRGLIP